jgi:hypothetical protein
VVSVSPQRSQAAIHFSPGGEQHDLAFEVAEPERIGWVSMAAERQGGAGGFNPRAGSSPPASHLQPGELQREALVGVGPVEMAIQRAPLLLLADSETSASPADRPRS